MFSGKDVGMVDVVVAGGTEGDVISGAKYRCFVFVTYITVDLHFTSMVLWY